MSSIDPAGCEQQLRGGTGGPGPPPTRQEPAGAAALSAGTHGQIPWPQLAQHSWEERVTDGIPGSAPAVPRRRGQGHFCGGGRGMDLQARDLLS